MIAFILSAVLLLHGFAGEHAATHVNQNVIVVEDGVLTGLSLPPYGVLCKDVSVVGGPEQTDTRYVLLTGETVELREQPKWAHRDWVMIAPGEWIPLSAVCWEDK